jgi:Bacterial DNA-binding protein
MRKCRRNIRQVRTMRVILNPARSAYCEEIPRRSNAPEGISRPQSTPFCNFCVCPDDTLILMPFAIAHAIIPALTARHLAKEIVAVVFHLKADFALTGIRPAPVIEYRLLVCCHTDPQVRAGNLRGTGRSRTSSPLNQLGSNRTTSAVPGFGILQVRKRPARMGRNPATGEAIKIKASKKSHFVRPRN